MANQVPVATPQRPQHVHPLLRDLAITAASSVITFVAGIIVISLFGRLLGALLLGEYLLVKRVMAWLQSISQMGLGVALPRYVAHAVNGPESERHAYFVGGIGATTAGAVLLALFLNLSRPLFARFMFGSSELTYLLIPLSILILGMGFHAAVYGYYRGCLKMNIAGALQVINSAVVPVVAVSALFKTHSVPLIVDATGLSMILFSCLFAIPIISKKERASALCMWVHTKALLRYGIARVPGEFAGGALFAMGPIIASHYVPLSQVAYLLLGTAILNAVAASAGPLGLILLTKVSMMLAQQRDADVRVHLQYLLAAALEVSLFACLQVVVFADVLVRVWVGPDFLERITVIRIEAVAIPFYLFYVTLRSAIDAASVKAYNPRNFGIASMIFAILATLATKLPNRFLLNGIAVALVAGLAVAAWLTARTVQRLYGLKIKWRDSGISLAIAIVLGAAGLLFHLSNGFRTDIGEAVIFEILVGAIFLIAVLKTGSQWLPFMWRLTYSRSVGTSGA
jgi:O-antigen/teichoic acid export membrane protein